MPNTATDGAIPPARVLEIETQIARGEIEHAERALAELVKSYASDPALQILLARLALKKKDDVGALAHFENALALQPDCGPAHVELARMYDLRQELELAQTHYGAALKSYPGVAELHNNLGLTYLRQERLDEAEDCFKEALRLKPEFAAALNNVGRVYSERNEHERAINCFREAFALDPGLVPAQINTGLALARMGEREQALMQFEMCHGIAPDHVEPLCGIAHMNCELGRLAQARKYFSAALAIDDSCADAHFGLANVNLLEGVLEAGWKEYEWRTRLTKFARYYETQAPRWTGNRLSGKTLLVHAEQGYGDTLMFARFLARLSHTGAHVLFRCRKPLVRLMARCPGVDRVIEAEAAEVVTADVAIPLLSLPHLLGITAADMVGLVPYLEAATGPVDAWRGRLQGDAGFRVGLAWRGNALRRHERGRVPSTADYQPLAGLDGITFYNLEVDCSAQAAAEFPAPLVDVASGISDFEDTAALIQNLDLVVSVDTAVAHLCGALNKPVWVLYPGVLDWRWEMGGKDSPWYPSARLFRRDTTWAPTLNRLARSLAELVH